jgi:glutamate racemase
MIGVFDSGLGGLTVLKELIRVFPENDFMYLADSANAPYGNKTKKEIYQLTLRAVDFLFLHGCILIILACNTVCSNALRKIQREYLRQKYPDRKVLGIVIPNIEAMIHEINKRNKSSKMNVAIIGTRATIESKAYEKELKKRFVDLNVYSKACPKLVPLIEDENYDHVQLEKHLKKYLLTLHDKDIILPACSHYVLLKKEIKKIVGTKTKILDTSKIIASKTKAYLKKHQEVNLKLKRNSRLKFYTTGEEKVFKNFTENYLQIKISVKSVNIK